MRELLTVLVFLITLLAMYRVLFDDKNDLIDCVKFWFTPDIVSMLRGEYWEDHWAELKLFIWLGSAAGIGYGVYHL